MSGEQKGGFIRTPHEWDILVRVIKTCAELKVTWIILRDTCGWHRGATFDPLTIEDLMERTQLSDKSVMAGVQAALARRTIRRIRTGTTFRYAWLGYATGEKSSQATAKNLPVSSEESSHVDTKKVRKSRPPSICIKESVKKGGKESTKKGRVEDDGDLPPLFEKDPQPPLTFELTDERREWAERNTPEIVHKLDIEVRKLVNWCNRHRAKVPSRISDKRFQNWLFKAVEFQSKEARVVLFERPPAAKGSTEQALDDLREIIAQEG